ncbi:UNVERIFIED_CONTAM: hypothetical protein Sangu_1009000 [Sesamum angustifolium]|uniref:Uncharacterized protein n=1 Tax=Sesamum angustifolium TaxID=2727405 RepID=A0AAW2PEF6_9LAMI
MAYRRGQLNPRTLFSTRYVDMASRPGSLDRCRKLTDGQGHLESCKNILNARISMMKYLKLVLKGRSEYG